MEHGKTWYICVQHAGNRWKTTSDAMSTKGTVGRLVLGQSTKSTSNSETLASEEVGKLLLCARSLSNEGSVACKEIAPVLPIHITRLCSRATQTSHLSLFKGCCMVVVCSPDSFSLPFLRLRSRSLFYPARWPSRVRPRRQAPVLAPAPSAAPTRATAAPKPQWVEQAKLCTVGGGGTTGKDLCAARHLCS